MTTAIESKNREQTLATLEPKHHRATVPAGDGACFSKHLDEEWLYRTTLRNSLRAWAAAQRSRWLRVPRVRGADALERRIDYEFVTGWDPVRAVIRDRRFQGIPSEALRRMFWTIGAALDEFHRYTHRNHGDFDFDNVLVKPNVDTAVFVDFTPPVYLNFRTYNRADPYWDIAMFVLGIRAKYPPHRLYLALRPETRELARAFIRGYFHDRPAAFDARVLAARIDRILETTYLGKSFSGRFLRRSALYRIDGLGLSS